ISFGKLGKVGIRQHGAMTEDLMKEIGFLQVIELFTTAQKGRYREFFVGQQIEKTVEVYQSRHGLNAPPCGVAQHVVNVGQLRNTLRRKVEQTQSVQIRRARPARNHVHLPTK